MATVTAVNCPILFQVGKLGTVRVDRTVDVYPETTKPQQISARPCSVASRQLIQKAPSSTQLVYSATPLNIQQSKDSYVPITKWIAGGEEEQLTNNSDIAVIYSVVRNASISAVKRTSSPKIVAGSSNIPVLTRSKQYVIERPSGDHDYSVNATVVTHASKQAQIKSLVTDRSSSTSIQNNISSPLPSPCSSSSSKPVTLIPTPYLNPSTSPSIRIQTSTSFTSHDRKPLHQKRPYSFRMCTPPNNEPTTPLPATPSPPTTTTLRRRSSRTAPRNVIERQLSNLSGRVSQLHEHFIQRLSDLTNSSHRQRNRSLTSLHTTSTTSCTTNSSSPVSGILDTSKTSYRKLVKPRPKSETYDDHHRIVMSTVPSPPQSTVLPLNQSAGSYASLTLLSHPIPKTSQKLLITNQNGSFRSYPSEIKRHDSNVSSLSTTPTNINSTSYSDTKKCRDKYEQSIKQLDVRHKKALRKEYERQKGKNNLIKVQQLEQQIKQCELQLTKLKKRLDLTEIPHELSSVKPSRSDENIVRSEILFNN
ncbi:unnamed protein product [Didymodactylos carnosus]|uniref:Uncharacterized protein n=1 Tax=Didymodactylos carnosus TaxID=1234261 RepID=A0A8S2HLG6_9BILA|nr:unnamed protein product [Didymodactylos carnosus]CAF3658153.1 unnamed protein product [Didymodactylos carnosus]